MAGVYALFALGPGLIPTTHEPLHTVRQEALSTTRNEHPPKNKSQNYKPNKTHKIQTMS